MGVHLLVDGYNLNSNSFRLYQGRQGGFGFVGLPVRSKKKTTTVYFYKVSVKLIFVGMTDEFSLYLLLCESWWHVIN